MNALDIYTLRSTLQLVDLSSSLDFRALKSGGLVVLWKGVQRGTVCTEKSDRTYQVAYPADFSRESRTCDSLGEAVLYLVPELRDLEAK